MILRHFGSRGILMRLPLFWQLESPLYTACRATGAPLFVNDQGNMPVGDAALRLAELDTVVTGAADATMFSSYLSEHGTPLPMWFIIHPLPSEPWDIPPALKKNDVRVAQEVHLFPGVPLLEQCPSLADNKEPVFHASGSYAIEYSDAKTLISSIKDDLASLKRYELPVQLKEDGTCPCGKIRVSGAI